MILVSSIHTAEDYTQARATIDALIKDIGDNETHPLAEVLDYLAEQVVRGYEETHYPIGSPEPRVMLHFLMDQHGLTPEDLADSASNDGIADILSGKREISFKLAQSLARRFRVRVDLLLREKRLG